MKIWFFCKYLRRSCKMGMFRRHVGGVINFVSEASVLRWSLPCARNFNRTGSLQTRKICDTSFSSVRESISMVGFLERQTGMVKQVTNLILSPLSLYQSCGRMRNSPEFFSRLYHTKNQKNCFSLMREPFLLPSKNSETGKIQDPKPMIKKLRIGDNIETAIVPYEDFNEKKTAIEMLLSSILKKRKQKMNKHKYKKRRARDKFKRLNLKNIKDRKQRAKDRAKERMKSSA